MKKTKVLFLVNKDNVINNFRGELAFELLDKDFDGKPPIQRKVA